MEDFFHVHTRRCKHGSEESDETLVKKAISLGAKRITFTDHVPFPENPFGNRMDFEELEEALVYEGVSKFPARIKCATISWKALEKLLNGECDE